MIRRLSPTARFVTGFLVSIGCFSALLQVGAVIRIVVTPLTTAITRISSVLLNLTGAENEARGTILTGAGGFSVNILDGCNGVYVTAIVISAVLAFPSTWREKILGLLIGVAGVHTINFVRIVSLYWIGLTNPDLFDSFHYYVWQTGVIIMSMAIWIFWAEVIVRPAAPPPNRGTPAAGRA